MARLDVFSDIQQVANDAYLDIRPTAGIEAVIHNIYHSGSVELYIWKGTLEIKIDSSIGAGAWVGYFFHVTNTVYLRVRNISGATINIGYDGIISKST